MPARRRAYGSTRAEVAAKLAKVRSDQQTGQLVEDERITVQQFLDTWLETVRPSITESTWTRYETLLRVHAGPFIGRLGLGRFGPFRLAQLFYPLLERAGLPRMRFHDLRPSAATLLLELGIHPKVVSEMLGHARSALHSTSTRT